MRASLDTDIIIHLYNGNRLDLLFLICKELHIFEFVLEKELKRKSKKAYKEIKRLIEEEKIILHTEASLLKKGIYSIYKEKLDENYILYDFGEGTAIALARTLGLTAFLTDDTKDNGPYETLLKELIEEVMPFAFYELLFLEYMRYDLKPQKIHSNFESINDNFSYKMTFSNKINEIFRRFNDSGRKRDKEFLSKYCKKHKISRRKKEKELKEYIRTIL